MTYTLPKLPASKAGVLRYLTLSLAGAIALAQSGPSAILMGEVHSSEPLVWSEATLIVESSIGGNYVSRAFLHPDATFELRGVPAGAYQVSLTDGRGGLVWHDIVNITPPIERLVIELESGVRQKSSAQTVSVTQLRRTYPASALRELGLAAAALRQNRAAESNIHLLRALEFAPDLQDARNNLGANYLRAGDLAAAQRELQAAVDLDPETPTPHLNLALTLLGLNRVAEAEAHARLALRRDPLSAKAEFVVGAVLERQGRADEALPFLERAGKEVPQSLLIQARIMVARRDIARAILTLREYLSRPVISQRDETQRWLELLSASVAAAGARL
jgi:tetratricopeptide (TPR) repeat protein